jgi:regulator of sigma E protease
MDILHKVLYDVVSFIIVLGIMVIVHEFGHFAAAKLCGVRVEVFSVGFGPRLFGIKRGDTDYRVCALPLGGYVKMTGENPGEEHALDPGDFTMHPRWQRMIIGAAGPFANFVLAFGLMVGFFMLHNEVPLFLEQPVTLDWVAPDSAAAAAGLASGDHILSFDGKPSPTWEVIDLRAHLNQNASVPVEVQRGDQKLALTLDIPGVSKGTEFETEKIGLIPQVQSYPVRVSEVTPGSPAAKAGLQIGDEFTSIDGHTFHYKGTVIAYLQAGKGAPLNLVINRAGQTLNMVIKPAQTDLPNQGLAWRIGFNDTPPPYRIEQLAFVPALKASVKYNRDQAGQIVEVLKRLLSHRVNLDALSGPVAIAQQTGAAFESQSVEYIVKLTTMISLNLGILNLLPFPILDGGLIMFLLIESLIRRDIDMAVKERVYQVAFVLIILFAAYIIFNDISKIAMAHS